MSPISHVIALPPVCTNTVWYTELTTALTFRFNNLLFSELPLVNIKEGTSFQLVAATI